MPLAAVPPKTLVLRGRVVACALLLAVLGPLTGSARAELLGTHPHPNGTVYLMNDLCREDDPSAGQRARQTVGGRERHGCWGIDRAGNPVVTWSEGSELVLDGDKVRLSRRLTRLLERTAAPPPRPRRSAAAPDGFARPAWCPNARFPHERLVCSDAELADRDLRLASLWRPYRRTLNPTAQAWHKSDYFRRLKACGADKACIVNEQETQMRRYGEALSSGG